MGDDSHGADHHVLLLVMSDTPALDTVQGPRTLLKYKLHYTPFACKTTSTRSVSTHASMATQQTTLLLEVPSKL